MMNSEQDEPEIVIWDNPSWNIPYTHLHRRRQGEDATVCGRAVPLRARHFGPHDGSCLSCDQILGLPKTPARYS